MKMIETLTALAVALALASAGAVIGDVFSNKTITATTTKKVKITVDVKSAGKATVAKGERIARVMDIPNPEGSFSSITYINKEKNKAYMKIFSSISVSDVSSLWNDLNVLNDMGIKDVELFINSPGGDAFSGLALADHLERAKRKGFYITAYASGIVASAAVPVLAVCNKKYVAPGTILMIHQTSIWKWPGRETASDIKSQNRLMELIRGAYLKKMAKYTNLTEAEWGAMENVTTWFGAKEALAWGLADEIG